MRSISLTVTARLIFSAAVFSTMAIVLGLEVYRDWTKRRQVAKRLEPVIAQVEEGRGGASNDLIRHFQSDGVFADLAEGIPGIRMTENLLREARVEWRPESVFRASCCSALLRR